MVRFLVAPCAPPPVRHTPHAACLTFVIAARVALPARLLRSTACVRRGAPVGDNAIRSLRGRLLRRDIESRKLFARHAPSAQRDGGGGANRRFIKHPCELEARTPCGMCAPRRQRGVRDAALFTLDTGGYTWRPRVGSSQALFLNAVPAHSRHQIRTRQCQGRHLPLCRGTTSVEGRSYEAPRSGSFLKVIGSPVGRSVGKPRPSKYSSSAALSSSALPGFPWFLQTHGLNALFSDWRSHI